MLSINYSYFAFDGTIHAIFPQFIGHAQLTFGNLRHQYFDPIRGGAGGKGMVRRIRFLKPLSAGILSNHRKIPPFGMAGGEPGQVGRNWVERVDGRCEELASTEEVAMGAGDVLVIETPGGGGGGLFLDKNKGLDTIECRSEDSNFLID